MSWIKDIIDPKAREWEEFYRNRWQHDRVVRSTHGVNCTGGCSWGVHVKDGLVTWELQMLDYPIFNKDIPPYEPRGCQRGISASWYVYSPIRVKYPYVRGKLLDFWRRAKQEHGDPVKAWASIVEDPEKRRAYQWARGKGGFKRSSWDEVLEIIASAMIYTIKKYGPDRIFGFSPIPAMSMFSFAGGSRFFSLLGGAMLSFYDWYCDLPPAHPEAWGEQTDVCESANWYESAFIAISGSNLNMTRTPDVHYVAEAKNNGTKLVVFSPDFSQVSKYADWWIPIRPGEDGAFWMAVNHVILKEFHHEKQTPYFIEYVKRYSDSPFLVVLDEKDGELRPGKYLRANRIEKYRDVENGDWKLLMWDAKTNSPKMPNGTLGFRWGKEKGKWNLELKDGLDGSEIDPVLTFLEGADEVLLVSFHDFAGGRTLKRGVPVKYVETVDGQKVAVATVYDLLMAQFGVDRGLPGDYPK
ncbi:MAG TPA: nitrate reductase subunit alpha, partial [Aquifex aeolicus]|nr:nitrate reductase subunit alpha [Aquifex aeolicus]